MIARVSHWKIKDGSYDAVMGIVNGSIRDAITGIDGLDKCLATLNRDTNEGVTIAVYRDQAAIDAAQGTVGQIWGSLADHLAGPPDTEIHEVWVNVLAATVPLGRRLLSTQRTSTLAYRISM